MVRIHRTIMVRKADDPIVKGTNAKSKSKAYQVLDSEAIRRQKVEFVEQ